jgi:hypothetical protein
MAIRALAPLGQFHRRHPLSTDVPALLGRANKTAEQDAPKANKTQPLDQRKANKTANKTAKKTSFRPLGLDEFQNGVDTPSISTTSQ